MGKIKERFNSIKNNKTSAAFAVYFFVIIVLLVVQLVNCGSGKFVTDTFGVHGDESYEFVDGHYIDTEFVVQRANASGIVLYGYKDNGIDVKDATLIVKIVNVETGEVVQKSEILLKDQIDGRDIYIAFNEKIEEQTRLKMSIRSKGLKKYGPVVSLSKTNNVAEKSWIDGEISNKYICAAVCYKGITYSWLKPCVYFVAEILIGCFLMLFQKKTQFPLCNKRAENKYDHFSKISLKKVIITLIIIGVGMFVFFDFVHMKTMESAVRAKDADVICEESEENTKEIFLEKGKEISQQFEATSNNLSAIAIHILDQNSTKGKLTFKIYDESDKLIFNKNVKIEKLDLITRHLTKKSKKTINDNVSKYCVLEFPEIIKNSKGHVYKVVFQVDNGSAVLAGDFGENYVYEVNGAEVSGNICMVALYSNQLILDRAFKGMLICSAIVLLIVFILAVFRKASVGRIFIISAVFLAFIYSFLIPPYCVPDERAHIDAVYSISNDLMGIEKNSAPGRIYKRACDIDNTKENTMDVTVERYRETFQSLFEKAENEKLVLASADNPVGNVTFLNYLPAAFGFTIARIMHFNMMTMIMFGRWMNALVSIILMWIGIKKIPFGKVTLAIIGLFPIVLQQISSCSYDGILIGAVFVYLAYSFSLLYSEEKCIYDLAIMILSGAFFAAACKGGVYIPLLGMFLIVFWELGRNMKEKIKWTIEVAIPLGLIFIGQFSQRIWGIFIGNEGSAYSTDSQLYTISYFKDAPNKLIRLYQNTLVTQGDVHLQQAIGGRLGRLNIIIPWYILIMFLILIILSNFKEKNEKIFIKNGQRLFMLFLCCVSVGLVMLSMLLAFTQVDCNFIAGVQGRYYLPMICLVVLCVRNGKVVLTNRNEILFVNSAVVLNIIVFGFALLSALG